MTNAIPVRVIHVVSPDEVLPSLVVQVTILKDAYMVWVGETFIKDPEAAVIQAPSQGVLGNDWSCAMPPIIRQNGDALPIAATQMLSTSTNAVSLTMAQRLSRKFAKQIFLSVDVSQEPYGFAQTSRAQLHVEKNVLDVLKTIILE